MKLTLKQICEALSFSRMRVDQWISRGYFRTPDKPILGLPREWDEVEALRLALFVELVESSITPRDAGALTQIEPHGFKGDHAFFVAWQGYTFAATDPNSSKQALKLHIPGTWHGEMIKGSNLYAFLANPDVFSSVVISIDNLWHKVSDKLGVANPSQ